MRGSSMILWISPWLEWNRKIYDDDAFGHEIHSLYEWPPDVNIIHTERIASDINKMHTLTPYFTCFHRQRDIIVHLGTQPHSYHKSHTMVSTVSVTYGIHIKVTTYRQSLLAPNFTLLHKLQDSIEWQNSLNNVFYYSSITRYVPRMVVENATMEDLYQNVMRPPRRKVNLAQYQ